MVGLMPGYRKIGGYSELTLMWRARDQYYKDEDELKKMKKPLYV